MRERIIGVVDRFVGRYLQACVVAVSSELQDRHVVARVGLALDRSKLPPELLAIEITEDVIINRSIRRTIDELIELGITLSIDDFGTGNSSLRQLGAYPASALKIDRSYISELDRSERGETVVRAIIGLADRFGLVTVAEGIERPSQVERLHDLGCTAGQGWVFDRALPYEEFAGRHLAGPKSRIDLRGPAPQTSIETNEATGQPVSERDAPAQPLPPT
jgi:EAL domain-containing protein (putative c-di-GMP-specific phosphodiesterase class I)